LQPAPKAGDSDKSKRTSAVHERLLLVGGFLGGISFTALVLILQSSNSPGSLEPSAWGVWGAIYFDALIMLVAGISIAFIMASVTSVGLAAGTIPAEMIAKQDNLALNYFILGWIGLLVAIPLLLLPFFWGASLVVGVLEISMFYRMWKLM